jgi:hypothetical protein
MRIETTVCYREEVYCNIILSVISQMNGIHDTEQVRYHSNIENNFKTIKSTNIPIYWRKIQGKILTISTKNKATYTL